MRRLFFSPRHTIFLAAILLILCLPPAAQAGWWPFGGDGIDYTITIEGADKEMQDWFTKLKLDEPTDNNPPKNLDELDQEANTLAGKVKKALDAKGYVESQAEPELDKKADPPVVHIKIEQGPRYPVTAISVIWKGDMLQKIDMNALQTKEHTPLDMEAIENDAQAIMKRIGKDSCLLSLSVTPSVQLFSQRREAEVVFTIAHGPRAHFGPSVITGNTDVHDSVIKRGTSWKQGDCFDASKIDGTRTTLIQDQLFSTVTVTPGTTPDAKDQVPVDIAVKERVPHTIGAGVDYSTDQGYGTHATWEHRNLWGDAEKFDANLTLAEMTQSLGGVLTIPAYKRDDQTLTLSSTLTHDNTDAYKDFTFDNSVGISRHLTKQINAGIGVGYTLSNTDDALTGINNYALISLPTFIEFDNRDNALDARKGVFLHFGATPYTETIGDGGQFLKLQATGQSYLSSDDIIWKPTIATRLSVGSIEGSKGENVPSDIRFYAGGGGSVRGYSYQSLSPQFEGTSIGGGSLIEGSAELRLRFTPTIGGVIFADGGNAFAASAPDFSGKIYYSAGVGARYYSPIGPLRLDIAFPINGADIGQTGYQFYVSLGQSF